VTDEPVDAAILAKPDRLAQVLARQKPRWEPGTRYAYHAFTLGWYEGELIRRVDPQQRTLGRFLQDEIVKPLGLEFYIGLPVEILQSRIAQLKFPSPLDYFFRTNKMSRPFLKSMGRPKSLAALAFTHAKDFDPRDRAFLALENPAFTGIGQVRSMARAYSAFATGGCELGITPRTLAALTSPPVPQPPGCTTRCSASRSPIRWATSGSARISSSASPTRPLERPAPEAVLDLLIPTPRSALPTHPTVWDCASSMTHGGKFFGIPSTIA